MKKSRWQALCVLCNWFGGWLNLINAPGWDWDYPGSQFEVPTLIWLWLIGLALCKIVLWLPESTGHKVLSTSVTFVPGLICQSGDNKWRVVFTGHLPLFAMPHANKLLQPPPINLQQLPVCLCLFTQTKLFEWRPRSKSLSHITNTLSHTNTTQMTPRIPPVPQDVSVIWKLALN